MLGHDFREAQPSSAFQSCPDYITVTSGHDFGNHTGFPPHVECAEFGSSVAPDNISSQVVLWYRLRKLPTPLLYCRWDDTAI